MFLLPEFSAEFCTDLRLWWPVDQTNKQLPEAPFRPTPAARPCSCLKALLLRRALSSAEMEEHRNGPPIPEAQSFT